MTLRREAAAVKKTSEDPSQPREEKRPKRAEIREIGNLLLEIEIKEAQ